MSDLPSSSSTGSAENKLWKVVFAVWGTLIMQKRYKGPDYMIAVLVIIGCSVFVLYPAAADISPYNKEGKAPCGAFLYWLVTLDLMDSRAHSKTNYLRDMIWKYTIRYSTQHSVLAFSVQVDILAACIFLKHHWINNWTPGNICHPKYQKGQKPLCMHALHIPITTEDYCASCSRLCGEHGLILQGNLLSAILILWLGIMIVSLTLYCCLQ